MKTKEIPLWCLFPIVLIMILVGSIITYSIATEKQLKEPIKQQVPCYDENQNKINNLTCTAEMYYPTQKDHDQALDKLLGGLMITTITMMIILFIVPRILKIEFV